MQEGSGGAEEIRPCLIGGFHDKIVVSGSGEPLPVGFDVVPRFEPCMNSDGSVASLDMVRLRLKFNGGAEYVTRLEDKIQRSNALRESYSMGRSKPGRFAHLYTLEFGESTVAVGVGQFVKGVQANMSRGFVEFNPNKLGGDEGFGRFVEFVSRRVERCELVRYDFALDLPVSRRLVRTRKDRRRYSFEQGSALTEYLGARNAVGRVKVYDKAAELGVEDLDLTRVEMTCSGEWNVEKVLEKWPTVYRVNDVAGDASDVNVLLALMCAELAEHDESPEKHLSELDYRRRRVVRGLLEGVRYECPLEGAVHVLMQATSWANRFSQLPVVDRGARSFLLPTRCE